MENRINSKNSNYNGENKTTSINEELDIMKINKVGKYELLSVLGRGTYGVVFLG